MTYDGPNGGGYGPSWPEGTVQITTVPGSKTRRQFSTIYLPAIGGFGPYNAIFEFVCDKVDFVEMVAGVGCGQGALTVGPVIGPDGFLVSPAVDISDDSSFELIVNEGFNSSGCVSVVETETRVVFTKN